MPEGTNGIWQIILLLLMLAAVFVAAHLATKFIATRGRGRAKNRYLSVVDSLFIGKDKSIMLIKAGEKLILVGVTGQSINSLAQFYPEDIAQEDTEETQPQDYVEPMVKWLRRIRSAPGELAKARRASAHRPAWGQNDEDAPPDDDIEQILQSINERKSRLDRESRGDDG